MADLICDGNGQVGVSTMVDEINDRLDIAGGTLTGALEAPSMTIAGERVLVEADLTGDVQMGGIYVITDENNAVVRNIDIGGDTSVEVRAVELSCNRVGKMATIHGSVELDGFDFSIPTDSNIYFEYNMLLKAQEQGWFDNIVSLNRGVANIYMTATGYDSPVLGAYTVLGADGWITLKQGEFPSHASSTMTRLVVTFSYTIEVS